ncbi:MAG: allantoinase, partial [Clostridium sp.]
MLQKTYDLIIKNGIAVFDDEVKKADIGVYDGKIVEISEEILGDANEVIDASSLYIFPATTDGHVHFNSPG